MTGIISGDPGPTAEPVEPKLNCEGAEYQQMLIDAEQSYIGASMARHGYEDSMLGYANAQAQYAQLNLMIQQDIMTTLRQIKNALLMPPHVLNLPHPGATTTQQMYVGTVSGYCGRIDRHDPHKVLKGGPSRDGIYNCSGDPDDREPGRSERRRQVGHDLTEPPNNGDRIGKPRGW